MKRLCENYDGCNQQFALTLTLGTASLAPALAASGASAPVKAVVGKVQQVTASSYMELKQISLLPEQDDKLI